MTPDDFRQLVAAGLTSDQIAIVMEMMSRVSSANEAAEETRKAQGRERWHRWNDKRKTNVSKHEQTLANNSHAREEGSSSNLEVSGKGKERSPSAPASKGCRLPDDFEPDIEFALRNGLSLSQAKTEAEQFKDYWRSKAGKDGFKLDWQGTWRMWVRNTIKRGGHSPPRNDRPRNAGEAARLELIRRGEYPNGSSNPTRPENEGDRNSGFAGTGIARRIAVAASR